MTCRPSSPIWGQSSRGNSLLRSISPARGAMRSAEKRAVVSRIASAVSPRPKSRAGAEAIGIMPKPKHAPIVAETGSTSLTAKPPKEKIHRDPDAGGADQRQRPGQDDRIAGV